MKHCLNLLLGLMLLSGCASVSEKLSSSGDLLPTSRGQEIYHLAALDKVEWTLKNGSKQTQKLDASGVLEIPPDQHLRLLGLTPGEAETILRQDNPEIVSFHWIEFRENSASVLGEVYNQTKVDLGDSPLRVLDAIAASGGFTPLANLKNVTLVRRNAGQVEVYTLNLLAATRGLAPQFNILVQPGDVITIRRSLL